MVTINLLPWREKARLYQHKKNKKIVAGVLGAMLFGTVILHVLAARYVNFLQQQNAAIEQELEQVTHLAEEKMRGVQGENTQQHWLYYRDATRNLMRELGEKFATDVCFTEISRSKNRLFFSGHASSAANFTDFLAHWSAATLFSTIKIAYIKQVENRSVTFSFQAHALEEEQADAVL